MNKLYAAIALSVLTMSVLPVPQANAEVLITKEEAELPASANVAMTTRGLTRGPGIEQVSPGANQNVSSPLPLKIKFQIRNDVEIDPASIKLTYMKLKPVDLTARLKGHIKPDGIEMDQAEVPPGVHSLRLDLKDKRGRVATAIIKLTVVDK